MSTLKIPALIIDDEPHARKLLTNVLAMFPNSMSIVGEAGALPEAIQLIQQKQPKVLFLDIDMPNFSGLDIKKFLPEDHQLIIVFVTAHGEYAIEAIRTSAFDYLLKPINLKQLQECIARVEKEHIKRYTTKTAIASSQRIEVNTLQQTHYIDSVQVAYIAASGMYAIIYTEKEQYIVSKPLKEFSYLEAVGFYRIHRSYLVNTQKIRKVSKTDGTEVVLDNGTRLPVSRNVKEEFREFMRKG